MQSEKGTCRIAIVGMGPRGLAALEALAERARQAGRVLAVEIFDPTPWPGAGPNFSPDESEHCLLNIPIRAVDIPPTSLPGATVTGFAEWLPSPVDPERFPARSELGDYLVARFGQAVALSEGHLHIERHRTVIERACPAPEGWSLVTEEATFGPFDEVLLALGQPQTKPDPQLEEWTAHARAHGLDLMPAYPANALLQAAEAWRGETVAIRGLGLSTMDVLRLLTRGLGGRFEGGRYHPSGREPACIVPFSLTGHAAVPKPANAGLDARFDLLEAETTAFETALEAALADDPGPALDRVCSVLAEVCARLLRESGTDAGLADAEAWLAVERDDPGAQETRSTVAALRASIAIANGEAPPPPGYVIGQVWRKWQPSLRRLFVRADADPETASALIGFSEGLKRFSYGPPVVAAEDLLILIESGLVDPRAADDPDITLLPEGWRLSEGERSVLASAMIDGVLPSPSLEAISEPLVVALCEAGRLTPVADGLGARVTEEGEAIAASGAVEQGLGVLGRLALGSVISVDSIHDCHGETTDRWADGVMTRRAGPAS